MATLVWPSVGWWWLLGVAHVIGTQIGQQHRTLCPALTAKLSATSHAQCPFSAGGGRSQPDFGTVFGSAPASSGR